mmetsp:Transcript_25719/g.38479  ORF Transcript_25719/g.38479 Transcript_25719/m.38479 type:complete len:380 (-) Transcript_25719:44-1183(-)|eukprot:CAMPEP_0116004708 /NCGR_PEP_ID=MMETSP0321-20121206/755_1 /TAXON_ID=163516 /ORGANISM="Leptocylindrus danicus var. danicus, Strain B650" /LENGTH=379 /DNA_ID=CAMNT_0003473045 /DNA_START=88 /DNA_END=1227 /DNA_ORIENTATION=-
MSGLRNCRTFLRGIVRCDRKEHFASSLGRRHKLSSSATTSNNSQQNAFIREAKLLQRAGAASLNTTEYDYFRDEISRRLVDRLDDIRRESGFPLALDIGSGSGHIHRAICEEESFEGVGGIGGVRKLVQMDFCEASLMRDVNAKRDVPGGERCDTYRLTANEEEELPFPDGTFDLVMSSVALHQINDLPKLFKEVKRVLKDDGCFLFAMVGGSTLPELRSSMVLAEMERDGGVSPHVGPFVDVSDVGSLLVAAGFQLPTIDVDTVNLGFSDAFLLMEHLQRMGEGNASSGRKDRVGINTFLATASIYQDLFPLDTDDEHRGDTSYEDSDVHASVQIVYAIGWTPHKSQQKPLGRGSATHKIGEDIVVTSSRNISTNENV